MQKFADITSPILGSQTRPHSLSAMGAMEIVTHFYPRLATSLNSTAVPLEFLTKVRGIFERQFDIEAETGEFLVEGRIYSDEVILRLGYLEKGRLKQINFEASMDLKKAKAEADEDGAFTPVDEAESSVDLDPAKSAVMSRLYTLIDALGSLMEEYFEAGSNEEEIDVPLTWRAYDFEGEEVFMQYSTVNSRLEAEADRILGLLAEDGLVLETQTNEDALLNAEIDSELAFEIQEAIRSGKYKIPQDPSGEPDPSELN